MKYERPAVERRVPVTSPVIAGLLFRQGWQRAHRPYPHVDPTESWSAWLRA